jgi:hypothetical protein
LERVTAWVLLGVLGSLGWVLLGSYQPDGILVDAAAEVIIVVTLLAAALVLVSVVALRNTRRLADTQKEAADGQPVR